MLDAFEMALNLVQVLMHNGNQILQAGGDLREIFLVDPLEQAVEAARAGRLYRPALAEQPADLVHALRALADQQLAHPMQGGQILLLERLDRYWLDPRITVHRVNGVGIVAIVLVAHPAFGYELGRYQDCVP